MQVERRGTAPALDQLEATAQADLLADRQDLGGQSGKIVVLLGELVPDRTCISHRPSAQETVKQIKADTHWRQRFFAQR